MTRSEQVQYIKGNYLDIPIKTLASKLGRSQTFVRKVLNDEKLHIPKRIIEARKKASRFKKGQKVFNKGIPRSEWMSKEGIEKCKSTQYKKGNLPENSLYNGAVNLRKDSTSGYHYYYVRISKAKWIPFHRHLWEQVYGKIPEGCNIQFKDGNSLNVTLENLYLINKKNQVVINKKGGRKIPFELVDTIKLINELKNKIKEHEKQDV